MKNIKKIQVYVLLITLVAIMFSGCNKDDGSASISKGHWSGTYTGTGDSGIRDIYINSAGKISGIALSNIFYESYELTGNTDTNGHFNATFGTTSLGGSFTGQMTGNSASGTWVNDYLNMNGTWTGSKEL